MKKLTLLGILFFVVFTANAQELKATVTINYDRVTNVNTQIFKTLQTQMTEFLNNTKFTKKEYEQNEKIETEVAIELTGLGESPAERAGLIILQALEKISIKALPADLPESLTISVESLQDEDSKLALKDVKLPKGVEYADIDQDLELVVANVYEPSALEAANAAAAGDGEDVDAVSSENGSEEKAEDEKVETK